MLNFILGIPIFHFFGPLTLDITHCNVFGNPPSHFAKKIIFNSKINKIEDFGKIYYFDCHLRLK